MRYWTIVLVTGACFVLGCDQPAATIESEVDSSAAGSSSRIEGEGLAGLDDGRAPTNNAARRDANEVLAAALREAKQTDKRVLVHYGADWCMWCGLLDECLDEHRDLLDADYVLVKFDETTMKNTDKLGAPWGKAHDDGIPWMAILDGDGQALITSSDGPTGINIGHPVEPEEIDHFMAMLKQTAQRLTPDELAELRTRWEKFTDKQGRAVLGGGEIEEGR